MALPKDEGFIVLFRSIRKKSYYQNATVVRVWLELLLLATYDRDEFEFNGKTMVLLPGELVTGRKALAKSLRVSESSVERALSRLEIEQQIAQRTDRQCRVITILNWDKYQNAHIRSDNDRTTTGQRSDNDRTHSTSKQSNKVTREPNTLRPTAADEPRPEPDKPPDKTEADRDPVNQVFDVFYENGNPAIKYGNKTTRADAKFLIGKFGLEQTLALARYACQVQGKQYAPTITTPSQLRDRLAQLRGFLDRNKNASSITFIPNV